MLSPGTLHRRDVEVMHDGGCACRVIMAAVGGDDWTLAERPAADATAVTAQRLWCARNMIAFASSVPRQSHLPVLLANLHAPVATLRHVAAAALHQVSSTNLGAHPQRAVPAPALASGCSPRGNRCAAVWRFGRMRRGRGAMSPAQA